MNDLDFLDTPLPRRAVPQKKSAKKMGLYFQLVAGVGVLVVGVIVAIITLSSKATADHSTQAARNAVNAAKKVKARLDVGINYPEYSRVVGEAWGDVKIFTESSDGKNLKELAALLISTMDNYKLALDIWHDKIEYSKTYENVDWDIHELQLECWGRVANQLDLASKFIEGDVDKYALKNKPLLAKDLFPKWEKVQEKSRKLHDEETAKLLREEAEAERKRQFHVLGD